MGTAHTYTNEDLLDSTPSESSWAYLVPSAPISPPRPTSYSSVEIELMGFKKGIKREIAAYPSLKDERYFDGYRILSKAQILLAS